MFTLLVPIVALLGIDGLVPVSAQQLPVAAFSVSLEVRPNGWSARCDSGCTWREVSFECRTACDAIVDANGLVTAAELRPLPTTFMFIVARSGDRIEASARRGTAWSRLSWTCDREPCRARIDGYGVSTDLSAR